MDVWRWQRGYLWSALEIFIEMDDFNKNTSHIEGILKIIQRLKPKYMRISGTVHIMSRSGRENQEIIISFSLAGFWILFWEHCSLLDQQQLLWNNESNNFLPVVSLFWPIYLHFICCDCCWDGWPLLFFSFSFQIKTHSQTPACIFLHRSCFSSLL